MAWPLWGPRERTFQQPSVSEAVVGWRPDRACFTWEPSRAAAATLSGSQPARGLNRFLLLFIFVMDDAERRGKLRWGQMLSKNKCPPLGLSTHHIQRNAKAWQLGWGQAAPQWHICVLSDFSTEAAEICLSRPEAKEQFGGRQGWDFQPCWRADIGEDRLADLPTCVYFSQTSILWHVWNAWPCWKLELPPA